MRTAVIVGAGGLGRGIINIIKDINRADDESKKIKIVGVADDSPSALNVSRVEELGYPYLGTIQEVLDSKPADGFVLGINNGAVKQRLSEEFLAAGFEPFSALHPSIYVPEDAIIGAGTAMASGVRIDTNVHVGRFCTVHMNAVLGHDNRVSDFVSINPLAMLAGEVAVGERTLIGAGSIVLLERRIGSDAIVGAQACVTKDVEDGQVVAGVPARVIPPRAKK